MRAPGPAECEPGPAGFRSHRRHLDRHGHRAAGRHRNRFCVHAGNRRPAEPRVSHAGDVHLPCEDRSGREGRGQHLHAPRLQHPAPTRGRPAHRHLWPQSPSAGAAPGRHIFARAAAAGSSRPARAALDPPAVAHLGFAGCARWRDLCGHHRREIPRRPHRRRQRSVDLVRPEPDRWPGPRGGRHRLFRGRQSRTRRPQPRRWFAPLALRAARRGAGGQAGAGQSNLQPPHRDSAGRRRHRLLRIERRRPLCARRRHRPEALASRCEVADFFGHQPGKRRSTRLRLHGRKRRPARSANPRGIDALQNRGRRRDHPAVHGRPHDCRQSRLHPLWL